MIREGLKLVSRKCGETYILQAAGVIYIMLVRLSVRFFNVNSLKINRKILIIQPVYNLLNIYNIKDWGKRVYCKLT